MGMTMGMTMTITNSILAVALVSAVALQSVSVEAQYSAGYGYRGGYGGGYAYGHVSVHGNQHHNYDQGTYLRMTACRCDTSDLALTGYSNFEDCSSNTDSNAERFYGSQARTWTNLCFGSRGSGYIWDDDAAFVNLQSSTSSQNAGEEKFFTWTPRIGDPFREFCRLISQYPNVRTLLGRGNVQHTVFAPTDTAFDQVQGIVGQVDEQKLLEIHILPEPRLTFDLRCGQTYWTINTSNNRKNRQRVKVRCLTASTAEVLGPGNYKVGKRPVIGTPERVFNGWEFSGQNSFTNLNVQAFSGSNNNNNAGLSPSEDNNGETTFGFSENVISCNGVIQVVNHVILPGNTNTNVYQGYYGAPNTQSMFRSGGSRKPRGRVGYYGPVGKGMGKGTGKGRGKGTVIAYGYYGGKGKKGHKGHKGHKGYYGHKGKKSHKGSKGHYYGGYYSSYGKGIGKGTGKGTGKGMGKGMGKGTGKGMGGYYGLGASSNYYGGGYYSGGAYYGGASVGVARGYYGGASVGVARGYYGFRRNLKEGEEAEDNFLSP